MTIRGQSLGLIEKHYAAKDLYKYDLTQEGKLVERVGIKRFFDFIFRTNNGTLQSMLKRQFEVIAPEDKPTAVSKIQDIFQKKIERKGAFDSKEIEWFGNYNKELGTLEIFKCTDERLQVCLAIAKNLNIKSIKLEDPDAITEKGFETLFKWNEKKCADVTDCLPSNKSVLLKLKIDNVYIKDSWQTARFQTILKQYNEKFKTFVMFQDLTQQELTLMYNISDINVLDRRNENYLNNLYHRPEGCIIDRALQSTYDRYPRNLTSEDEIVNSISWNEVTLPDFYLKDKGFVEKLYKELSGRFGSKYKVNHLTAEDFVKHAKTMGIGLVFLDEAIALSKEKPIEDLMAIKNRSTVENAAIFLKAAALGREDIVDGYKKIDPKILREAMFYAIDNKQEKMFKHLLLYLDTEDFMLNMYTYATNKRLPKIIFSIVEYGFINKFETWSQIPGHLINYLNKKFPEYALEIACLEYKNVDIAINKLTDEELDQKIANDSIILKKKYEHERFLRQISKEYKGSNKEILINWAPYLVKIYDGKITVQDFIKLLEGPPSGSELEFLDKIEKIVNPSSPAALEKPQPAASKSPAQENSSLYPSLSNLVSLEEGTMNADQQTPLLSEEPVQTLVLNSPNPTLDFAISEPSAPTDINFGVLRELIPTDINFVVLRELILDTEIRNHDNQQIAKLYALKMLDSKINLTKAQKEELRQFFLGETSLFQKNPAPALKSLMQQAVQDVEGLANTLLEEGQFLKGVDDFRKMIDVLNRVFKSVAITKLLKEELTEDEEILVSRLYVLYYYHYETNTEKELQGFILKCDPKESPAAILARARAEGKNNEFLAKLELVLDVSKGYLSDSNFLVIIEEMNAQREGFKLKSE